MSEEKQEKVKVTLKVPMSESEVGHAAKAGDVVEVDAEVAERWIASGTAEEAPTARERLQERVQEAAGTEPSAEKPAAVPRRGSS